MIEHSFRRLFFYLMALAVIILLIVGGICGCKASKQQADQGEEEEITNGKDDYSTGPGQIAFVRENNIYLANADGSGGRRLTSSAAGYGDLAFSPSGKKLAATKEEGDAMPQLVLIDVPGGNVTDVSWTNPDYSAAWTAAGVDVWFGGISWAEEDLLYCTGTKNTDSQMRLQVVKYELSAHKITIIEGDAQNPSISPDGTQLAYIQQPADWAQIQGGPWNTGDYGDLVIRQLGDGSTRILKGNVFEAVFAPYGKHLAITFFDEPDTTLLLTDLDAKRLYTLKALGPSGTIRHPSFSPAGDKLIAYRGWREIPGNPYTYNIFIVPTNQDNPPGIEPGNGKDPAWGNSL